MWNFKLIPAALALGLLARAEAQVLDAPKLPSTDPFYTPEASDWAKEELGTVLDFRRVNIDISAIPNIGEYDAFQLLYVTSDVDEQKTTSVTTIIVPQRANMSRILSYQIAYDAPDINCSPSYGLQPGANTAALPFTRDQMNLIAEILNDDEPPVLNLADYEGSNAAFTVGPQSAYQTLDSIRAATSSGNITGIDQGAETILFGYSGGGYASEWAVELHKTYQEKNPVNIIGAAIGGPPTNIIKTYRNVNMKYSPLNVWAMLGVMNAFPEINKTMADDLKETHKEQFLSRRQRCSEVELPPMKTYANINWWFKNGDSFLTTFESELMAIGVLGNHISPETAPKFPLYIFQGGVDFVTAPFSDTEALKDKFCQAGTPVSMYKWKWMDHVPTSTCGSPWAMKWIRKVFNREEIEDSCNGPITEVPPSIIPGKCPSPE
jgi:triacylglycerol lipase